MSENLNSEKKELGKWKYVLNVIEGIGRVIGGIIFLIVIIGIICFYINSKEVDNLNKEVANFNSLISEINNNNSITTSQYTDYANQFQVIANSFKESEKDSLIGSKNRVIAKNNSEITEYMAYRERILANYFGIIGQYNLSNLSVSQIQSIINQMQNLLASNNFTQINSIYNASAYTQQKITEQASPQGIENTINQKINDLSVVESAESIVNNYASY